MSKIKLIIFDYDGTLIDCSMLHYTALNNALCDVDPSYEISYDDHLDVFDSLTTVDKLTLLHDLRGLSTERFEEIKEKKKIMFTEMLSKLNFESPELVNTLRKLQADGYSLAVASNADSSYVKTMLYRQGILNYFEKIYTREDCSRPKPHPQMYMMAMTMKGVKPSETLILEDGLVGHKAVVSSGAHLMVIEGTSDVTYDNIIRRISDVDRVEAQDESWYGSNVNVVIPMAGAGSRFQRAGYPVPKPLVDVNGMPMIQAAIELINLPNAKFTFIVQKEHNEKYGLTHLLHALKPGSNVVCVDGLTEGAACTVLAALDDIPHHEHLVISNCDQRIEMNWASYFNRIIRKDADASVVTFEETEGDTKWSYAALDENGWITEVKEKQRISSHATSGIYHFRKTSTFINAAKEMIAHNDRVNNEFYVAPVYNYVVKSLGGRVMNFKCDRMYGLGTPDDLRRYTENDSNSASG
jgi:HAD superfamily hydrolase (TIGR01509 family)